MKIAIVTEDGRNLAAYRAEAAPSFGMAPAALLEGLAGIPQCEVHVLSCVQQPVRPVEKLAANIHYHSLLVPKWGWMRGAYAGCVLAVRRKLREIKPDVVHGQGTERYCAVAAVFSGFPNVVTIHGNMRALAKLNKARPFSFSWLAARLERLALPRAGGVVCITAYTRNNVRDLARATWLLPNAVDSRFFSLTPAPVRPRQILCVATVFQRKNQVALITALDPLAQREKFELVFLGAADQADPYAREFFDSLRTRPWCRFAGFADRAALRLAYAAASLVVLTSLEDNCPMVVLEAMAAGVPVAAANVGGVPELVTNEVDGLLFDPKDAESIRSSVTRLLLDEALSANLAKTAKAGALARFHPRIIALRHLEIYRELLKTSA
jgi:glycosyltransferase involved in cell wall biosynthesis